MTRSYPCSLHNHTHYSNIRLRDCIIRETELIDQAIKLGHRAVAITDHESVSGWMSVENYSKKIKKEHPDFKVIRGNEIYLVRNGLNAQNFNRDWDKYYHFILLAKDLVGAQQIMEISTRAWKRSYVARQMRRVPTYYNDLIEVIGKNPGHVIGSTACLGGCLPTQLLRWRESQNPQLWEKIIAWLGQMQNIFGKDNFYLELQPSASDEQTYVNHKLLELSGEYNIPYIITTDSHYLTPEDRPIHKAFLNAQNGDREVDSFYAMTYMMDTKELENHLDLTDEQFETAYKNINEIIDKCEEFTLARPLKIPSLKWRNFSHISDEEVAKYEKVIPLLSTFKVSEYESDRVLVRAIVDGIKSHPDLDNAAAYTEINLCLEDTLVSSKANKAQWSAYFLNLQKIIDVCWEAGTLVGCGRGSGVGFILLYCLGITQINPLRESTTTYRWRFLNPERVSVLDIDVDIEGCRRAQTIRALKNYFGEEYVSNVATFGTEQAKNAIQTAARGLGIDVDIASYVSSLIPSERGKSYTLKQCFYGDEEEDIKPVKAFVYEMTEHYPELWKVSQKIEGLICRLGEHAGGVVFVDEPFTNSTALMRTPNGDMVTAFELHTIEQMSLIKMDLLSVEALDKIHNCINLICDYGYAEWEGSLRDTYESLIGIYKLERNDPKMWEMVWNHEINSLFQMEKQSGVAAISLVKPTSVDDLATMNSVIRLMAQEKGGEQPLNKFARYKANPQLWDEEMAQYGLTEEEMNILRPVVSGSYGICESQEGFMQLVQIPECGWFDLNWADRLRKAIAKKAPKDYDQLTLEYYDNIKAKGLSYNLCNYVWKVLVAYSRGYGFNKSHTLAYSLIALQEMNLGFKYPIIFWNCACLISDSGGDEDLTAVEAEEHVEDSIFSDEVEEFIDDEDDDDDDDDEEEVVKKDKKVKRVKVNNYGKIASAIGRMTSNGIQVSAPNINHSVYTFSPDVENNCIIYGLSGITRISDELIRTIIANRPYVSVEDFLNRIKVNKTQMVNLIKAGAFDEFGHRIEIMYQYAMLISDVKKRVTLQNMRMLIDFDLLPQEYDMDKRIFNFNKYLKTLKLDSIYYGLDNIALEFYSKHFDIDKLTPANTQSGFKIKQTIWDAYYKKSQDHVRPFIKANHDELLNAINDKIIKQTFNKYCVGSEAQWEMESLSCYIHEHELKDVNVAKYGLSDFGSLPDQPVIDRFLPVKGKRVPIYKLDRIYGTVLDRDKNKRIVTLLTTNGVATVKIFGGAFAQYDQQISEKGADGKKHVIEKSMFTRGNKLIITGIKTGDTEFLAKKYSRTPYHLVELITEVEENGDIITYNRFAED